MSSAAPCCKRCGSPKRPYGRRDKLEWICRPCETAYNRERRARKRSGIPKPVRVRKRLKYGALDHCHSCNQDFRTSYSGGSAMCPPCDAKWKAVRARHNALNDCSDDLLGIATDIRRAYERLEIASGAKRRPDFWSGV